MGRSNSADARRDGGRHGPQGLWKIAISVPAALAMLCACDEDPGPAAPTPLIPAGVENSWQEARKCRTSHEHWLHSVRVVVNPPAWLPYTTWLPLDPANLPFPVGSVVVKPEYDDQFCENLIGYTVMRKEPAGYWPAANDWHWQRLDAKRKVLEDGKLAKSCASCHQSHCDPPAGYDFTCTPD